MKSDEPPKFMRPRYYGDCLTYVAPRDYKAYLQQYDDDSIEDNGHIFLAYKKKDSGAPNLLFTTEFRADTVAEARALAKAWADSLVAPRVAIQDDCSILGFEDGWIIMIRPDIDGALDKHRRPYGGLINLVLEFDSSVLEELSGIYYF